MSDARVHVSVVLPCYDEEEHVVAEVERVCQGLQAAGVGYEVIAVDDGSTDRTRALLDEVAEKWATVRVIPLPANGGVGSARRIGTREARGDVVVWTDCDMTYPNDRIAELVATLDDDPYVDMVVGARTSEEGRYRHARRPAKYFVRRLAEFLTSADIPDLNSGFRAFRRDVALPYLRLLPAGFSCVTTLTMAFLHNHRVVVYEPIAYAPRSGTSKFHPLADAYRYLLQVVRMVMYFNPLKVLMPVALVLFVVAVGKAVYDNVRTPFYFTANTVILLLSSLILASFALLADLIVRGRDDGT